MEILVRTTFWITIGFSMLNLILSTGIFSSTKDEIQKLQAIFWGSLLMTFLLQKITSDLSPNIVILGYAVSVIPSYFLSKIALKICGRDISFNGYGAFYLFLLIWGLISIVSKQTFTVRSFPFSIMIALPLIHSGVILIRRDGSFGTVFQVVFGFFMIIGGIHGFNFSFFREAIGNQTWGWLTVYGLYQLVAIFLPILSLEFQGINDQSKLGAKVLKRTKELERVNKDLDKLHRKNSMLLKVLLHDISNYLGVIGFYIKSIYRKSVTGFKINADDIEPLSEQINNVAKMLDQLKRLEKVKKEVVHLDKEFISLGEIEEEIHSRFGVLLKTRGRTIEFQGDRKLFSKKGVYADRTSFFSSILSNVISNSIKHSDSRYKIIIKFIETDQGDELRIINRGFHILKEDIPKAFSFKERRINKDSEGTGFGLPIVKELITLHGGKATLHSKEVDPGVAVITTSLLFSRPEKKTGLSLIIKNKKLTGFNRVKYI